MSESPNGKTDQRKLTLTAQSEVSTSIDVFRRGSIIPFDGRLVELLKVLDLPSKGILAETSERGIIFKNLPEVLDHLPHDRRNEADYLAKFVAAAGVGLFDAALSYIWDATIANLRDRVANFDLTYFYDVLFTNTSVRGNYRSVDDLVKVEDWQLISGCREIGLIDELGFKNLSYIRDMRNYASAAHPNNTSIDGLSLASWLQSCIRHVLSLPPDEVSIRIKKLLMNIRTTTLKAGDEAAIVSALPRIPDEQADSLLKGLFGIYIDSDSSAQARTNVELFAPQVWGRASDDARRSLGQKYFLLSADAEVAKKESARRFLQRVDGLSFTPETARAAEMSTVLDDLRTAHNGWGNFYNEPPHAMALSGYVPADGAIPTGVNRKYVRIVTLCRCGNAYGYSWAATTILDPLIAKFSDAQIQEFVLSLDDKDIDSELAYERPVTRFKEVASALAKRTTNAKLQSALQILLALNPEDYKSGRARKEVAAVMRV